MDEPKDKSPIYIYNTLSRKKEKFKPVYENEVRMYTCGPTVYNYIHIGNARPLIFFDVVRRYFEYLDYKVTYVQNITDIDDKIIAQANEENTTTDEIAKRYTKYFQEDCEKLGVKPPTHAPKATEYVGEMIKLIQLLIDKGYAYEVEGNVFFEVSKYNEYGRLSGKDLRQMEIGERVDDVIRSLKKAPGDFTLWKPAKPDEPSWASPWGDGRPGWHTECVVMSTDILNKEGRGFDIHTGGIDLIFPHHENEIAQARCSGDAQFAKYWMHNEFLNLKDKKMAKSEGNVVLVRDLVKEYRKEAIRLFFLQTHYRKPINFSKEYVKSWQSTLETINRVLFNVNKYFENSKIIISQEEINSIAHAESTDQYEDFAIQGMNNDFNTAVVIREMLALIDVMDQFCNDIESNRKYANLFKGREMLMKLDSFMGIIPKPKDDVYIQEKILDFQKELQKKMESNYSTEYIIASLFYTDVSTYDETKLIDNLLEIREKIRKNKDWELSDFIRVRLNDIGIIIEDTKDGTKWRLKL